MDDEFLDDIWKPHWEAMLAMLGHELDKLLDKPLVVQEVKDENTNAGN